MSNKKVSAYTKEKLLKSKRYENDYLILRAVLKEEGVYTLNQVDQMIADFKKGRV